MDKPLHTVAGSDQGQRDGVSGRGGLLQGQQRHRQCRQRGERPPQHQVGIDVEVEVKKLVRGLKATAKTLTSSRSVCILQVSIQKKDRVNVRDLQSVRRLFQVEKQTWILE